MSGRPFPYRCYQFIQSQRLEGYPGSRLSAFIRQVRDASTNRAWGTDLGTLVQSELFPTISTWQGQRGRSSLLSLTGAAKWTVVCARLLHSNSTVVLHEKH